MKQIAVAFSLVALFMAARLPGMTVVSAAGAPSWDFKRAATYMDARQDWWQQFPTAARDHDTVCVSCHSSLPYVLARPSLRTALGEQGASANEMKIVADVVKRVRNWRDMEPWYPDQTRGLPKTAESRGTESVINAAVLARRDADAGMLSEDGRQAFANMWAQQMRTGDLSGTWAWLSFRLEPWEGVKSAYFGAALAAIAVGTAPGGYGSRPEIQKNLELLRTYLTKQAPDQHTFNRLMLLWASSRLPGLLTPTERDAVVAEVLRAQQADGGWRLASLGPWKRGDGSNLDMNSDGYATGLATFVLRQSGLAATHPQLEKGLRWLVDHQDKSTGRWLAASLNKQHDPSTEPSKFMNDVATAYAVLALTSVP